MDKLSTTPQRLFAFSRFLIILPILGSFVSSIFLLLYTFIRVLQIILEAVSPFSFSSKVSKDLALGLIEAIDLFLIGTVFYIIALGLYELFIDDRLPLPDWLAIHTLDDLKSKLIGVIILALGVQFLGQIVTWDGNRNLLSFGVAIAIVTIALTYFLSQRSFKKG